MSDAVAAPRRIVPETIQTSGMDCGPAALHSLLAGFGIPVSYGRLREACQTDVDGTSIDALESVARTLGLDVAQLMLPADHVALRCATAMPAIAVSLLPSGMPHFVVAWRRHGRLVQVMDPATGRRIVAARTLPEMLYIHEQAVPFAAWEGFAASPTFQDALHERLRALGLGRAAADELVARAGRVRRPGDGGARRTGARSRPPRSVRRRQRDGQRRVGAEQHRGRPAARGAEQCDATDATASHCSSGPSDDSRRRARRRCRPTRGSLDPVTAGAEPAEVMLRGAVLVRARGRAAEAPDPARSRPTSPPRSASPRRGRPGGCWPQRAMPGGSRSPRSRSPSRCSPAARSPRPRCCAGRSTPWTSAGRCCSSAGIALVLAVVETLAAAAAMGIGRRLEIGLRRALAVTLPRLPDRYLRSRPPSDMAERAHALHELRMLPLLATQLLAAAFETLFVAIGLCVLDPSCAPYVALATAGALGVALMVQLPLRERELRAREHASALGQTTLDAVLGVLAIRAHGAERALRAEHDDRLRGWIGAARAAVRARTAATFAQTACGIGLAIPVVVIGLDHLDSPPERLLLVLWAVTIPVAAERVGQIALQWPQLRTLALRLAEPLDASAAEDACRVASDVASRSDIGVAVAFEGATVRATGQDVLAATTLRVAPGEHVALVGLSGAGKSTLLALALGLADPSEGRVTVGGGEPRATWPAVAWADPQVRVWNRDLAHNVAPLADAERLDALVALSRARRGRRAGRRRIVRRRWRVALRRRGAARPPGSRVGSRGRAARGAGRGAARPRSRAAPPPAGDGSRALAQRNAPVRDP